MIADISHERLVKLLNYDPLTGVFTNRASRKGAPQGAKAGSETRNGYVELRLDYKSYLAHRLAWFYVHKTWPEHHIDHKNHVRTDNRIANLRDVTQAVNNAKGPNHTGKLGKFGVPGVNLVGSNRNTLGSAITVNRKQMYLGLFPDIKTTYETYRAAKRQYHGVELKPFEDYGIKNMTAAEAVAFAERPDV